MNKELRTLKVFALNGCKTDDEKKIITETVEQIENHLVEETHNTSFIDELGLNADEFISVLNTALLVLSEGNSLLVANIVSKILDDDMMII